ncbi:hypothetical protein K435DRAFT_853609 [Dendrothele bispora CBS 962.96]|uniref:Uncharacterized protein n=1 Tax=Dendrothele bispora (strain CBS 962.96) TaxID=1314807 RepID=A0A4S8MHF4_DENBC|nr:hypothetical protein K435DRAFT_853609 [Dendrothele bispora CBS 962.96]
MSVLGGELLRIELAEMGLRSDENNIRRAGGRENALRGSLSTQGREENDSVDSTTPTFGFYATLIGSLRVGESGNGIAERLGALESNLISLDDPTTSAQPPVSSTVSVISDTPQPEPVPQTASICTFFHDKSAKRKAPTGPTKSRKRKKVDYTKFTQIDKAGTSAPNSPPLPEHESDCDEAIPTSFLNMSNRLIKKQPFQTGIENTDIKTAPRVGDLFSSPSLRNQGLNSFVIPTQNQMFRKTNPPFVTEVTPEKTVQGGVDIQEEAEPSLENLMRSLNDSSGVEIVDLPESTNSPCESDMGNQPLSTSSLLDAQFHRAKISMMSCTMARVLKDAPDDMLVSKSGPESALAPLELLAVANKHDFPSITPTRKEMEEILDSESSQINQTNAVLSPVPTTNSGSELATTPLVQLRTGSTIAASRVVANSTDVGSASAEPSFVANGSEPAIVSQIEMEAEKDS